MAEKKEPFVGGDDHPDIKEKRPVANLHVIDLLEILWQGIKPEELAAMSSILCKSFSRYNNRDSLSKKPVSP